MHPDDAITVPGVAASPPVRVLICLFGSFRVLKAGEPIRLRGDCKAGGLLTSLALRDHYRAPREALLDVLWPDRDAAHAIQSLTTLVHVLRQLLSDGLNGEPPVVYRDGGYGLNLEAGIGVDIAQFDALANGGARLLREGNAAAAMSSYQQAVELYTGDVCTANDVRALVERERLRSLHLSLLARLADHSFQTSEYLDALRHALRLLLHDPCREDAHRLVMRCHVRLGSRAQALRQYHVCRQILKREFAACPEPATEALYTRVRLEPGSV